RALDIDRFDALLPVAPLDTLVEREMTGRAGCADGASESRDERSRPRPHDPWRPASPGMRHAGASSMEADRERADGVLAYCRRHDSQRTRKRCRPAHPGAVRPECALDQRWKGRAASGYRPPPPFLPALVPVPF